MTDIRTQSEPEAPSLLDDLHQICVDMYARWDSDQRSGKLITALDGIVENYDPRVTRIRQALASHNDLLNALKPFAEIAQHDIGKDEADHDFYRVMSQQNARAPSPRVGHFRKALALLSQTEDN